MRIDLNLNRLLSFTSLVIGWIGACSIKFYLYNVEGFGRHWTGPGNVTFSEQASAYFNLAITWNGVLALFAAIALDWFLWPYFFRDEVHEVNQIT